MTLDDHGVSTWNGSWSKTRNSRGLSTGETYSGLSEDPLAYLYSSHHDQFGECVEEWTASYNSNGTRPDASYSCTNPRKGDAIQYRFENGVRDFEGGYDEDWDGTVNLPWWHSSGSPVLYLNVPSDGVIGPIHGFSGPEPPVLLMCMSPGRRRAVGGNQWPVVGGQWSVFS